MTRFIILLAALTLSPVAHAADPVAGEAVYKTQCGLCHAVIPNKNLLGPSMFGIVGRGSGSVEGFRYSPANKDINLVWTAETLDKFVTAPKEVIPGTTMLYSGLKDPAKRAELIAYLETLH